MAAAYEGPNLRGRKPKPAALRRLEGNRSRRPMPATAVPALPDVPWPLNRGAKREWEKLALLLHEHDLLTALDGRAVAALAQVTMNFRRAQRALDKYGPVVRGSRGSLVANPAAGVLRDSLATMIRLLGEFGLTPSARMRVAPVGKTPPDENEFEKFLRASHGTEGERGAPGFETFAGKRAK